MRFFSATAIVLLSGILLLTLPACEIVTQPGDVPDYRPAPTVVINEVFSLPLDHPTYFCWIEFINPTRDTVDLSGWTLSLYTQRFTRRRTVLVDRRDGSVTPVGQMLTTDGVGTYDVPFTDGFSAPGFPSSPTRLSANNLLTIVDNKNRLEDHTEIGPGPGPEVRERRLLEGPIYQVDTVAMNDTIATLAVFSKSYLFQLLPTAQILLKNASAVVVDVVRYGNYVYDGPGTDPYPANQSFGPVPLFESLVRYSGGYYTGNTSFDFYSTRENIRPIPQYYSQLVRVRPQ
jgi:hypothetical protein